MMWLEFGGITETVAASSERQHHFDTQSRLTCIARAACPPPLNCHCHSHPRMRCLFTRRFEKKTKRKTGNILTHLFKHPRTRPGLPPYLTLCSAHRCLPYACPLPLLLPLSIPSHPCPSVSSLFSIDSYTRIPDPDLFNLVVGSRRMRAKSGSGERAHEREYTRNTPSPRAGAHAPVALTYRLMAWT
jgi:hypothetical protein